MAGLRTVMVTVRPLLGELVIAVLQPYLSLDMIGVLQSRTDMAAFLSLCAPDLVLLGLHDDETECAARALLPVDSAARILALSATGQEAWLVENGTAPLHLGELSMPALIKALVPRLARPPP